MLQTLTGWREFGADQAEHQQPAAVLGRDSYVRTWAEATFENWQSDFLQLLTMVGLTSLLIFRGSPESKDGDEEMKQALERIETRLNEFARTGGPVGSHPGEVTGLRLSGD